MRGFSALNRRGSLVQGVRIAGKATTVFASQTNILRIPNVNACMQASSGTKPLKLLLAPAIICKFFGGIGRKIFCVFANVPAHLNSKNVPNILNFFIKNSS